MTHKTSLWALTASAVLFSIALGQWSAPVNLGGSTQMASGPVLVPTRGDTVWAAWVGPWGMLSQILARRFAGDSWGSRESIPARHANFYYPSGIKDDSGRVMLACYQGEYRTLDGFPQPDSWGIYTTVRGNAGWSEPEMVFPTMALGTEAWEIRLGYGRNNSIGMAWEQSPGVVSSMDSVMYSRKTPTGWLPRVCLAPGIASFAHCLGGSLIPGDSTTFHAAFMRWTTTGGDSVHVWTANDTPVARSASFRGRLPLLARSTGRSDLVFVRSDTLYSSANQGTGWTAPVMVTTGAGADQPWLACDPLGWTWVVCVASSRVLASHKVSQFWSAPETVAVCTGTPQSLYIAFDELGTPWVAWNEGDSTRVTRRTTRPGIEQSDQPAPKSCWARSAAPGVLFVAGERSAVLLDITGRKRAELVPGLNAVQLGSGVYFVRWNRAPGTAKVVLER